MKKSFLILLLAFPILSGYAQQMEKEVHISNMTISVDVIGAIAFTTYDIELYNPNYRQMEYELILPLASNETVIDYKLDINGKLCSGVVVDKNKARQVFESIVRRRV